MQGRLDRQALSRLELPRIGAYEETHCCNYLLATDIEMDDGPDGYAATCWEKGYGDYVMKPDLSTLRRVPWLEGTAIVLCDMLDHHTHEPVPHSPRADPEDADRPRRGDGALTPMMATELEFFLFEQSYDEAAQIRLPRPGTDLAGYNDDYSILQTTKEEYVMRPIRNMLVAAGIPVENTKGEAETGPGGAEHPLCRRAVWPPTTTPSPSRRSRKSPRSTAIRRPSCRSGTTRRSAVAAHIHQSLLKGGSPAFHDADAPLTTCRRR